MLRLLVFTFCVASFLTYSSFSYASETSREYRVGDIKLLSILDKPMLLSGALINASPDILKQYLNKDWACEASVNVFLADTGKNIILIDTGAGVGALQNMIKAGYKPDKVTEIFITHLDADHFSGALSAGVSSIDEKARVFKNAKIYIPLKEFEFWANPTNREKFTKEKARFFDDVSKFIKIYKDRIIPFDEGVELPGGVIPINAPGHTMGHTMYKLSSLGEELIIWGDIMHCLNVQISEPSITVAFDIDQDNAAKTRISVMENTYANKTPVAGSHLPFPGVIMFEKRHGDFLYRTVNNKK